jgi:D-sedoheptulose 7-phosphate isomerase
MTNTDMYLNMINDRIIAYETMYNSLQLVEHIAIATKLLNAGFELGGKVITAGNGGSAALADHFAAELVGRYKTKRRSLPAVALTSNSINTAIANDFEFRQLFSYQLKGFNQSLGDNLVLFTTSGRSKNILAAIDIAKSLEIPTIVICGKYTEMLKGADLILSVNSDRTDLIQEIHQTIVHLLCEGIDKYWEKNGS